MERVSRTSESDFFPSRWSSFYRLVVVSADCVSCGGDSCALAGAVETCRVREGTFRSSMISTLLPPPGFDDSWYQRFAPPTGAKRLVGFLSELQLPPFDAEVKI